MAGSVLDSGGGRDELKTQFMTREGTYHLMTLAGCLNIPCHFEAKFKLDYSRIFAAEQSWLCQPGGELQRPSQSEPLIRCQGLPQFGVFRFFP